MKKSLLISFALGSMVTFYTVAQTKSTKNTKTNTKVASPVMLKTKADKFSYAIGLSIAQGIKSQGLSDSVNVRFLAQALEDVLKDKPLAIQLQESQEIIQSYFMAQQSKAGEKNVLEGKKFLDENKKKPGVITLPSGLQYIVLQEGSGEMPKLTDNVTTHYHGTLINGEIFDSSVDRGQPASFPVNGVIKGWTEALQLMKTGSKWKLFVPADLAYGDRGSPPKIGPNTTLIFDVELISIDKK